MYQQSQKDRQGGPKAKGSSAVGRMVTLKDVAQKAGVTHSTVSRAINHPELLSKDTLTTVQKAIKELNYKPNPFARGLQTSYSKTIALIVPNIQNLAFANIARGVQKALTSRQYSLIIASASESQSQERLLCQNLSYQWVDGVIFASSAGGVPPVELLRPNTPKVLIERLVPGYKFDSFFLDIDDGVHQVISHLHALGHRKIAVIVGDHSSLSSRQRLYAFQHALSEYDLPVPDAYIQTANWTPRGGWEAMERLIALKDAPTAVFVTTDTMALGAMGAAVAHGLKIPDDLSVVGFNNEPGSGEFNPPLTTLDASYYNIGVHAAEVLLMRIEDPNHSFIEIIYPLELVERASTGPVKETRS